MAQALPFKLARRCAALAAASSALLAGAAAAQSMTTNSSTFNGGWGRANGQENQSVAMSMVSRDANGNREIVDGIMQTGAQTVSARAESAGTASAGYSGGVGGGSALAVGNSLTVITQGDYNTVIVNSTQINNGAVSANTNVSGGVGE
jgi:holdfast attachment protein HfaA